MHPGLCIGWLAMVAQLSRSKPHILAVAPSNVAVDNMIQRIMDKGFHDGSGGRYNPSILRLGAGSKVTARTSHCHCRSLLSFSTSPFLHCHCYCVHLTSAFFFH